MRLVFALHIRLDAWNIIKQNVVSGRKASRIVRMAMQEFHDKFDISKFNGSWTMCRAKIPHKKASYNIETELHGWFVATAKKVGCSVGRLICEAIYQFFSLPPDPSDFRAQNESLATFGPILQTNNGLVFEGDFLPQANELHGAGALDLSNKFIQLALIPLKCRGRVKAAAVRNIMYRKDYFSYFRVLWHRVNRWMYDAVEDLRHGRTTVDEIRSFPLETLA